MFSIVFITALSWFFVIASQLRLIRSFMSTKVKVAQFKSLNFFVYGFLKSTRIYGSLINQMHVMTFIGSVKALIHAEIFCDTRITILVLRYLTRLMKPA